SGLPAMLGVGRSISGPARSGIGCWPRAAATVGTRRRRRRTACGHLGVAVEVGAFLDNQRPGVDFTRNVTSRTNLDPTLAIDLAVDMARNGHLRRGQARRDVRLFLDDDRALAFDLALNRAKQSHRAFGLEL